jgi:hypothetical protein
MPPMAPTTNENEMKSNLLTALLLIATNTSAAPVVYTNEALFLVDLTSLGYSTISESFEDTSVWGASRNSIPSPGSTPSVTSQGIVWTSNYSENNIATGTVGGSAPDGAFAIYSLPHGMTGGSPKITFLLDGVDVNANDTDNIENWQREGDFVNNWSFIGVIDIDGFASAELRELRGKDFQQVLIFNDDFTTGVSAVPVPAAFWLFGSGLLGLIGIAKRKAG